MGFTPTTQQVDIDNGVREGGSGSRIKVRAFAGTGKTSTLKLVTQGALGSRSALYIAFNKAIATEAKSTFPRNVECRTAHSLAYGKMKRTFIRDRELGGNMLVMSSIEHDPALRPILPLVRDDTRSAAFAVVRTLVRWCQTDRPRVEPDHVPGPMLAGLKSKRERNAAAKTAASVANAIWERIADQNSRLPITHDFYLKAFALGKPALPYDAILFDEAQDANGVLLGLVHPQGAQQIYVGDTHQAIYGFRGAIDAMEKVKGAEFALTKSWRFGPNIAAEANVILEMLGEKSELVGGGSTPGLVFDFDDQEDVNYDAVLCRGNAGVIKETLDFIEDGRRVAVVGGVDQAVRTLWAIYDLYCGKKPKDPELALFKDWDEFKEYADGEDGGAYRPLVRMVEDRRDGTPELCMRLKTETVDERDAEVVVSTAHKAKGREWDSVRFSADFAPLVELDDDGEVDVFHREEANLMYVSITRAMKRLDLCGYADRNRYEAQLLRESGTKTQKEMIF